MNTITIATVTVAIDVHVGQWSPDCTIDQVVKQASIDASNGVEHELLGSKAPGRFSNVRVISVETRLKTTP